MTDILVWADDEPAPDLLPSGAVTVVDRQQALDAGAGCAVILPRHTDPIDDDVLALLRAGIDVVTTGVVTASDEQLRSACDDGGSTFHHTGLHAFVVELVLATILQAPTAVSAVRIVEAFPGSVAPDDRRHRAGVLAIAREAFGAQPSEVAVEIDALPGDDNRLMIRGLIGDRQFYTGEVIASSGVPTFHGDDLPFGGFTGAICYTVVIDSDPGDLVAQWEFDRDDPALAAKLAFDAVDAVRAASPGILSPDPQPRYQHDDRLPTL